MCVRPGSLHTRGPRSAAAGLTHQKQTRPLALPAGLSPCQASALMTSCFLGFRRSLSPHALIRFPPAAASVLLAPGWCSRGTCARAARLSTWLVLNPSPSLSLYPHSPVPELLPGKFLNPSPPALPTACPSARPGRLSPGPAATSRAAFPASCFPLFQPVFLLVTRVGFL